MNDELARKPVDARWDRSMGGEHGACAGEFKCSIEVHTGVQVFADALQAEESGMALVGVNLRWSPCPCYPAVGTNRAYTTHAEQHLLLEPMVGAAAVQPVCHLALIAGVLLHIGVQQQQRYSADLCQPDLGVEHPTGEWDFNSDRATLVVQQGQRQRVRIQERIALLLPARGIQRLPEVALPIQQTNANDRNAKVAGSLQVITGENAQATGVLREYLGDAELG